MNTKKEKIRKVAISTSIEPEYVEAIDRLAEMKGWNRPLTIRHLLKGLIDSLNNTDHNKSPWHLLDNLKINATFGDFEKGKK